MFLCCIKQICFPARLIPKIFHIFLRYIIENPHEYESKSSNLQNMFLINLIMVIKTYCQLFHFNFDHF